MANVLKTCALERSLHVLFEYRTQAGGLDFVAPLAALARELNYIEIHSARPVDVEHPEENELFVPYPGRRRRHETQILADYPVIIPDLPDEWNNPSVNGSWEKITALRDMVLKEIELAKEKGVIKDPLESEITLRTASKDIINFLNIENF